MVEQTIRTFICLEIDEAVRAEVRAIQRRLSSINPLVKWAGPEQAHLTLHFLGEISPRRVTMAEEVTRQAAADAKPLVLRFGAAGSFPNAERPRVLWIGVSGETEHLVALQKRLGVLLATHGFGIERRAYAPHLTLARVREPREAADYHLITKALAGLRLGEIGGQTVTELIVMKSELFPTGPVYTPLAHVPLGAPFEATDEE